MSSKQRLIVVLEDADTRETVPVESRLKRFLKAALRSYGLRCTWIAEKPPAGIEVSGLETDVKEQSSTETR